jgi:glucose/arabinose dehydrogenase
MQRHVSQALLTYTLVLTWYVLFTLAHAAADEEWITQPGFRVVVDTTGYDYPVSIAFVPQPSDHPTAPLYYVAELHGRIKVVTRQRTVHVYADNLLNFSTKVNWDMGLVGLCVDPVSTDVFATMVFDDAGTYRNKITRFRSHDGGLTAASAHDILVMSNEEMWGNAHQIQQCSIGPDGKLYVNVGNGDQPNLSQDLNSLQGKILRVQLDGSAPEDNPFFEAGDPDSPKSSVFALGLRNPFAMVWRGRELFVNENGVTVDRLMKISAGANIGYEGTDRSMRMNAIYLWGPPAAAPVGMALVQDAGFPLYKRGHIFIGIMGPSEEWHLRGQVGTGREIQEIILDEQGRIVKPPEVFTKYVGESATTLVEVATGPDGLYFSEFPLQREGAKTNILKIVYDPSAAQAPTKVLGGTATGAQVYASYGCAACHMMNGQGGRKGPELTNVADTLRKRLHSDTYIQSVQAMLNSESEGGTAHHQTFKELLQQQGDARVRHWIKTQVRTPRVNNPASQMPAFDMSQAELDALVNFLMASQPPSWFSTYRQKGLWWLQRHKIAAALGFGVGTFCFGIIITFVGLKLWNHRSGGRSP